jgi:hypothetical protein
MIRRILDTLGTRHPPLQVTGLELVAALVTVVCWFAGWQLLSFAIFVGIVAWRSG